MDKMEWSQAKSIAARIYGDAEIDGDLGDDGDTKSDREKQDAGDSKSGVKTIKTLIETEDEELDRIIEDMLAVLPRVEKIYALADIKDYFVQNPKLLEKTTIFAFEGLADENLDADSRAWNGQNKYHMNGQFGAIMLVAKEGKLTYYEAHASTLPDNMETAAMICEGIYEVKDGSHKGYIAMWLNNSDDIPAYNSIHQNDVANAIHFHMAGKLSRDNPANPYSEGCITIPVKDYIAFGKHVGFISEETDDNIGSDNIYGDAKIELNFSEHTKAFEGYIVIDRQYYDDTEGYLKFNGLKGEE